LPEVPEHIKGKIRL